MTVTPSAQALTELATGYWPAAALIAAVQLRVFDYFSDRATSAGAAAEAIGAQADRLESLLDALVAMRVLSKTEQGAYVIAAEFAPLLSRSSPVCMLDALAYNADLYRQWANLADVVRGDAPPSAGQRLGGQQLGGDPAITRRFVMGMEAKARAFGPAIVEQIDLGQAATLLDVGSGPGTLSRMLLERHRALRATLLDLPPVLAVAQDVCAASPVADRLSFHPADYRRDVLPSYFDVAVYAGALHQETTASAAALFGKLRQALLPGGRLFVVDFMLDDNRTSPAFSAMFQLNMMLLRPGSKVFAASEVVNLLHQAGFINSAATSAERSPYAIVSASRPR